jgi:hypothetical protein
MAWSINMVYCDRNKCYIRVGEPLKYKIGEEEFQSSITGIYMRTRFGPGMLLGITEPEFFTDLHGDTPILSGQITTVDGIKYIHEETQS